MSSSFERFCRIVDQRIVVKKGRKPRLNVYCVAIPNFDKLKEVLDGLKIESKILSTEREKTFLRIRMKQDDSPINLYLNNVNEFGWLLIAEGKKEPAEALLRIIDKIAYGLIQRTYLHSSEIRDLYETFCKNLEFEDYHVTNFYARRRSEVTFGRKTLPKMSLAIWQKNAENRFKEYERLKSYLTSLKFKGIKGKDRYSCMITRENKVVLIEGKFTVFVNKLAISALEVGLNNLQFFRNRARRIIRGKVETKPFEYHLDSKLSKSHIELLESALDDVSNYALIYKGNPYFLASCYDRSDGSVYRVSALGKRVVIVPLNDVTESALQRLFLSLSEHFIEKAPQEYVKVDESPWVPI